MEPARTSAETHGIFTDAVSHQPNSGKRRTKTVNLEHRTPNRIDHIRDIFEGAASNLANTPPPSGHTLRYADILDSPTANNSRQRVRLSVHKADSDYITSSPRLSHQPSLPSLRSTNSHCPAGRSQAKSPTKQVKEPPSSGRKTPSRIPRPIASPLRKALRAGYTYGETSDDEDIHSTHGVPLIMPIRSEGLGEVQTAANVTQWLASIRDSESEEKEVPRAKDLKKKHKAIVRNVKDKENVPPSGAIVSNYESPAAPLLAVRPCNRDHTSKQCHLTTAIAGKKDSAAADASTTDQKAKHIRPLGLLRIPPRRMGKTPENTSRKQSPLKLAPSESGKQTTKYQPHGKGLEGFPNDDGNDTDNESVVELSPGVTQSRKGRCPPNKSRTQYGRHTESDQELSDDLDTLEREIEYRYCGRTTSKV